MLLPLLKKYTYKGNFTFKPSEDFKDRCNAPTNEGGIYLIYKVIGKLEELIYIGSSGQRKDGDLKIRKSGLGGMKDRLVNGYHPNRFGEEKRIKRRIAFPSQMQKEEIKEIKVYWYVTYIKNKHEDFPTDVERILINHYLKQYSEMPAWHQ